MEFFGLAFEFNNNDWFVIGSTLNFKRPVFKIFLDDWIIEFSSDKSLGVKDSIMRIFGSLIQSGITN
jgi:hypothetical protein